MFKALKIFSDFIKRLDSVKSELKALISEFEKAYADKKITLDEMAGLFVRFIALLRRAIPSL